MSTPHPEPGTLEDGIYLMPPREYAGGPAVFAAVFVQNGHWSSAWRRDDGLAYLTVVPPHATGWTRMADLPKRRMPEPELLGSAVMAGSMGTTETLWVKAREGIFQWIDPHEGEWREWNTLDDARPLTDAEYAEHGVVKRQEGSEK